MELRLAERPARLTEDDVDIDLRIGLPSDGQFKQRLLLASERVLVASPATWPAKHRFTRRGTC